MSTYTPGPWNIIRSFDYTDDPADTAIMSITADDGTTILFTDSGYFKPKEANARLIAASPDMYEALRLMYHTLMTVDTPNSKDWARITKAVDMAAQAIAKAEGMEPTT